MKIYIQVKNSKLIEISDIENENHNSNIEASGPEDIHDYISSEGLEYDESEVEEFIRVTFNIEDGEQSLSSYNIKHWVSNRSFGELIEMYNNKEILVPHMQRSFVWDSVNCSRLIESIILGLPIPPLFLLEISDNKYELIDGFQRLTALANYVGGKQWNYNENVNKRVIASKLSGKVAKEIAGKTYKQLKEEYQMKIRRSTIPLIEFKQFEPNNYDSKYLIFERINTGSVKLNAMQIRKSLSYGDFIKSLYEGLEEINVLKDIFSITNIKKDAHIEAVLRTLCFYDYSYREKFIPTTKGIKNMLNEYCEIRKNQALTDEEFRTIREGLELLTSTFEEKEIFKRVKVLENGEEKFAGNLNISIFESLLGAVMKEIGNTRGINKEALRTNFKKEMIKISEDTIRTNENPFSISTGTIQSIKQRFYICDKIVRDSLNDI